MNENAFFALKILFWKAGFVAIALYFLCISWFGLIKSTFVFNIFAFCQNFWIVCEPKKIFAINFQFLFLSKEKDFDEMSKYLFNMTSEMINIPIKKKKRKRSMYELHFWSHWKQIIWYDAVVAARYELSTQGIRSFSTSTI